MTTRHSNLLHKVFGRLQVLSFAGHNTSRQALWLCLCSCGNQKVIIGSSLTRRRKNTLSCGCRPGTNAGTSAGGTKSPEYRAWSNAKTRCYNSNDHRYKWYGARGIQVCDRWLHNFDAFFEDMGLRPSPDHSLDRYPNVNGNYEPDNCRWATPSQQAVNKRKKLAIESFSNEELLTEVKRRSL